MFQVPRSMIKVMVFGVFDGLHKGHKYFLSEAKKLGDSLIAVVTTNENVKKLKGNLPAANFNQRQEEVLKNDNVDEVVPNDRELFTWKVLDKHKPDIIAIGYDQTELEKALADYIQKKGLKIKLKVIPSFKPHRYKSSLINNH
ncbi:MAG: adenylyltransferase/cytidyltransferase family protein [bacterium]|nr:adenylyltransferase/cytidyltransferase family protein [bacterium]